MSISLSTNKEEKFLRLCILAEQGSISWETAILLYIQYCRLYDKVKSKKIKDFICNYQNIVYTLSRQG